MSERPGLQGAYWPEPLQEAALHAALDGGDRSRQAWDRLCATVALDDHRDAEIQRLYPLVYVRLRGSGHPDLGRLKGLHRRAWYLNTVLVRHTAPSLAALEAAGIPTVVLKGLALATTTYADLGARPMQDIDVLVPPDRADAALDLLEADGYRDAGGVSRDRLRRFHHGSGLVRDDGASIDLHWTLGADFVADPGALAGFFGRARAMEVAGVETRELDPTDQLLHVIVHGSWSGSDATVRWIADAVMLAATHPVAWDRLIDESARWDVVLPVRNGLRYLSQEFDVDVPESTLATLERMPVSSSTRRRHRASTRAIDRSSVAGGLAHLRAYWAHVSGDWGRLRSIREFPTFVAELWELDHARQVPRGAVERAVRRIRSRHPERPGAAASPWGRSITVIVPTALRPDPLRRCLDALAAQTEAPDEVLVVRSHDDEAAARVVADHPGVILVDTPGTTQVAKMRAGAERASGAVVAFVDDDAAPRRGWCAALRPWFSDPRIGAVGGPDVRRGTAAEPTRRLGRVHWTGRVVGMHERTPTRALRVHHLRGANMAVRAEYLRLPVGLRGSGAEPANDLAISLAVGRAGRWLVFDPDVVVDHVHAPRADMGDRDHPDHAAMLDWAFNESYAVASLRPGLRHTRLAYALLIGDRNNGGLLRWLAAATRLAPPLHGRSARELAGVHVDAWKRSRDAPLEMASPVSVRSVSADHDADRAPEDRRVERQ